MEEQRAETYFDLNLSAWKLVGHVSPGGYQEILSRPQEGFYLDTEAIPVRGLPIREVDTAIDPGRLKTSGLTSYRMLKVYNPWLMDSKLPNRSGKSRMS